MWRDNLGVRRLLEADPPQGSLWTRNHGLGVDLLELILGTLGDSTRYTILFAIMADIL
jgi:hypothetical protein